MKRSLMCTLLVVAAGGIIYAGPCLGSYAGWDDKAAGRTVQDALPPGGTVSVNIVRVAQVTSGPQGYGTVPGGWGVPSGYVPVPGGWGVPSGYGSTQAPSMPQGSGAAGAAAGSVPYQGVGSSGKAEAAK
ncbi:MAG TPA: hypothetical protein DCR97_12780 [Deltaproteobacteria bacterium]|nr:hypothetical protein [Deltaproteobacteria bacterium]